MPRTNPERPLAAHVQAASAAGRGVGQAKIAIHGTGHGIAAHVQAALGVGQAKVGGQGGSRKIAAHVQAVVAAQPTLGGAAARTVSGAGAARPHSAPASQPVSRSLQPMMSGGGGLPPSGGGYSNCFYCHSPRCNKGSLCGKGEDDLGGLFEASLNYNLGGYHKDTKKFSKRRHRESEHMLPMQVVKRVYPGSKLDNEPAHSITFGMHRSGQGGAGGGITSTGSSHTAKGWAAHLVRLNEDQGAAAMIRAVAVDTYNSAELTGQLSDQIMLQIRQVLEGHVGYGRITNEEAGEIFNELMNWYLNQK
jgi:hypothetical protein